MKGCVLSMTLGAAILASAGDWTYKWPGMTPAVQECSFEKEVRNVLKNGAEVTVACADGAKMSEWVATKCQAWFKVKAAVKDVAFSGEKFPNAGGYSLVVKGGKFAITAAAAEGVRYAMFSLRQLARPVSGTLTVGDWELPELAIRDWPSKDWRGFHLCAFPEISLPKLEQFIRLAAYYKFNYVVLDTWGTYRSEKCPWFGFRDGKLTLAECRRLAAVAKDLGVTLVPQINFFGHGSAARQGKHAVLYHAPEYAALFEPGSSWNWCLTNPETRKAHETLMEEIYEAFGRPGWVHLGGEAPEAACAVCNASDYPKVVLGHLEVMCAKANALGARPLLWTNMLGEKGLLAKVRLPSTLVVSSPDGLRKAGFNGMIAPLWHRFAGHGVLTGPACSAWGGNPKLQGAEVKKWGRGSYPYHLRQVSNDTPGGADYENQGWFADQVRRECVAN